MAIRRAMSCLFLEHSRVGFAISACLQRGSISRNILRTLHWCAMKDLTVASEGSSAGISTGSVVGHENGPREITSRESEEVETRWKRKFLNTPYCGEAIFILGPMGAGKTTVIENEFKCHPGFSNYAYVDTDEIMGMLKGFASDRVEEYYPLARSISIRLTDWILERKISFVAEGTCVKYLELIDYMHRLKSGGYLIRVKRLPWVSLETVLERAKHRKNRLVPEHVVRSIYNGSNEGLKKLYEGNREGVLFEDMDMLLERSRPRGPIVSAGNVNT